MGDLVTVPSVSVAYGDRSPRDLARDAVTTLQGVDPNRALGEDDAEVWIPPITDCMGPPPGGVPCPHCRSGRFHHRTRRCGECGRRPTVNLAVDPNPNHLRGPAGTATPMDHHRKMQYRAAAHYATRVWPGPVGELVSRELLAVEDFGYLGSHPASEALVADVLAREVAR